MYARMRAILGTAVLATAVTVAVGLPAPAWAATARPAGRHAAHGKHKGHAYGKAKRAGRVGTPAAPSVWDDVEVTDYPACPTATGGAVPCFWDGSLHPESPESFYVDPAGTVAYLDPFVGR